MFAYFGYGFLLIILVAGLFAYLRYDQTAQTKKLLEQDETVVLVEYKRRVINDSRILSDKTYQLIELLKQKNPSKGSSESLLIDLKREYWWTLKGLQGRVSIAVWYEKDLRRPKGASLTKHKKYRQTVVELLSIANEISNKKGLKPGEKVEIINQLGEKADNLNRLVAKI